MEVEVITDRERWNAFVEAEPTGNVTQTYEWGDLRDGLGGDAVRLGAVENGVLSGTMLIVVGEAPLLRRRSARGPQAWRVHVENRAECTRWRRRLALRAECAWFP